MRQKRTFITLAIVVCFLILGVAYAAITTQQLKIEGSASTTVSDANFDVNFISVNTEGSGTHSATIDPNNSKKITFNIEDLTTKGQSALVKFVVKNESPADVPARVTFSISNSNSTWFEAELGFTAGNAYGSSAYGEASYYENGDVNTVILPKGVTVEGWVNVKLLATPVTDEDVANAKATVVGTISAEPYSE